MTYFKLYKWRRMTRHVPVQARRDLLSYVVEEDLQPVRDCWTPYTGIGFKEEPNHKACDDALFRNRMVTRRRGSDTYVIVRAQQASIQRAARVPTEFVLLSSVDTGTRGLNVLATCNS
jgi:hypothetical protein